MSIAGMLVFFGTAVAYAAAAAAALWALARLAGVRDGLARVGLPAFAGFLLVFLALHPFPDPAAMTCPRPDTEPQLVPLHFLERFGRLAARGAGPGVWIRDLTVVSTVMNFLVCALFGLLLARAGMRPPAAAAAGLALSLGVETAQVTGLFGLYPCPYRQFDVDDLILNAAGTLAGAGAGAAVFGAPRGRRPRQ